MNSDNLYFKLISDNESEESYDSDGDSSDQQSVNWEDLQNDKSLLGKRDINGNLYYDNIPRPSTKMIRKY